MRAELSDVPNWVSEIKRKGYVIVPNFLTAQEVGVIKRCFGAWLDSSHNPMVPVKKPTFAAREEHGAVLDTTPLIDVMKKVAREMVRAPT